MIAANDFLAECKKSGINLFTGTPCSYLKPFINKVIDDPELNFVETTNEGDAVALASGAWLGGKKSIVMFQNSGLGNAVNPITSLSYTMNIPFIGIVTLRGEPGGAKDEPQHELMGQITVDLLELMQVAWDYFPSERGQVAAALAKAEAHCAKTNTPFMFVMQKGSVEAYELQSKIKERNIFHSPQSVKMNLKSGSPVTRTKALESLSARYKSEGVLIGTTGKTGRELFEINDRQNNLYMVGSMGCALPIGLGVSCTDYKESICVIDGDGALLMRMGNMALAGQMSPQNLVHILLDNGVHDSTGGQQTFSEAIDFANIACSCGYQNVFEVDSVEGFESALDESQKNGGLSFIRFLIAPGSPKDLGRPTITPKEVAHRMRGYIEESYARNNS